MRTMIVWLILSVLSTATLAGCLGDNLGGDAAPRAVVSVEAVPDEEDTFVFDGRGSTGNGLTFEWSFGDGATSTEPRVEHTYAFGDAVYDAKLVVRDRNNVPDVWEDEVVVGTGENEPPVALFKLPTRQFALNESVRVDAGESTDPDGDPLVYRWDFNHLMDLSEYEEFRAAKDNETGGTDDSGDQEEDGGYLAATSGMPAAPELPRVDDLFGKKHEEPDDKIRASMFTHVKETSEPVYVMESGYPDATTYFIRLQVRDVKGGHEKIVSEEIWGVKVSEAPPSSVAKGTKSGNLTFGAPTAVMDLHDEHVPDAGQYEYEARVTFLIHWPVVAMTRVGNEIVPGGFVNLTWTTALEDPFENRELVMNITSPNGTPVGTRETAWGLQAELDGNNDYIGETDDKPWRVHIVARAGYEIEWTLDWWAMLDTNPLRGME